MSIPDTKQPNERIRLDCNLENDSDMCICSKPFTPSGLSREQARGGSSKARICRSVLERDFSRYTKASNRAERQYKKCQDPGMECVWCSTISFSEFCWALS